jgi:hypothetical protein
MSQQSALNQIRRLEAEGIVREVTGVPGRSKRWVSLDVFDVLEPGGEVDFRSAT